jgi:hypothetical protein
MAFHLVLLIIVNVSHYGTRRKRPWWGWRGDSRPRTGYRVGGYRTPLPLPTRETRLHVADLR